jgi:hypothetical protein
MFIKVLRQQSWKLGKRRDGQGNSFAWNVTWAGFARRILFDKKSESVLPSLLSMNQKL